MKIENIKAYVTGKIWSYKKDCSARSAPNCMVGGGSSEYDHVSGYNMSNSSEENYCVDRCRGTRRKVCSYKNKKINKKYKICETNVKNCGLNSSLEIGGKNYNGYESLRFKTRFFYNSGLTDNLSFGNVGATNIRGDRGNGATLREFNFFNLKK